MADKDTVAVLGAGGIMGFAMARNLAGAGYDVRAWNRSREKADPLSDDGVTIAGSPAEAAENADVILTMLPDADTVLHCMSGEDGALSGQAAEEAVWLQMSTIGEQGIDRCVEMARDHGLELVDAPALGTKQPAQEGKLVILAAGPERLQERMTPIFDVLGQRTMWVGGAGAGTRLKLAVNVWLVTVLEGAAETLALAEGLGLDPQLVLDAVSGGPLDLPYLQMKGKAMLSRDFEPSFRLKLAAKDARLAQEAAERHGLDLPLVDTIRRRLEEAVPEHGDDDMSATYLTSAPEAAAA
ncbi:MAG: NAD(P)-dependent oxidoreductase [Solirubrobacteraceae bacterium]